MNTEMTRYNTKTELKLETKLYTYQCRRCPNF